MSVLKKENQKPKGRTKRNTKGQGSSGDDLEDAANKLNEISKAAEKNPKKIEFTDKSKNNFKKAANLTKTKNE